MGREANRKAAQKHLKAAEKAAKKGDKRKAAGELQSAEAFLGFGDTAGLTRDVANTRSKLAKIFGK